MYSSSKHGVRYALKQNKTLPATASAPTCQTCHMQEGNHEVRTAWGFLAVRLPMPDDILWKQDRTTILQALGVLDPAGNATKRLDVVKAAQVARLTARRLAEGAGQDGQDLQPVPLRQFRQSLSCRKATSIIKEADHAMAEAIRIVAGLYKDGIIPKPKTYDYAFPDLLTFNDAPTPIETEALQHVPGASEQNIPGNLPQQPGLCVVVRLERDAGRSDQYQVYGRRNAQSCQSPGEGSRRSSTGRKENRKVETPGRRPFDERNGRLPQSPS